jgi:hypothetical protein
MSWQIISAIIGYLWLFGILLLLFLMWRNSTTNAKAMQVLSTVALKNAESTQKVADAVYILAKHLEKPIA